MNTTLNKPIKLTLKRRLKPESALVLMNLLVFSFTHFCTHFIRCKNANRRNFNLLKSLGQVIQLARITYSSSSRRYTLGNHFKLVLVFYTTSVTYSTCLNNVTLRIKVVADVTHLATVLSWYSYSICN